MVASYAALRPRGSEASERDAQHGTWWDNFCLDSEHDYDPVWRKFEQLGVVPGFHSGTIGQREPEFPRQIRSTTTSAIFLPARSRSAKALLLGGVTARFPKLKFSFMTAGVAWAALLLSDLVEQWSTRRIGRAEPARSGGL